MRNISVVCWLLIVFVITRSNAQETGMGNSGVYVDSAGVLRWKTTQQEVALFGVNYTTPFAHAYRAQKRLGVDLKKAIELDVAHMARLGFDAFRVHVWDREISDSNGNLLLNEHLDLFDFLLATLAKYNIKSILTPIAWWGNGWPEQDEPLPGFSQRYSRLELITNPHARAASKRYLQQFLTHINSYTNHSCLTDPSILAIEIINEPTHPSDTGEVTAYINEMVRSIRATGFGKPIFYNISQNWSDEQANAVANADIDGVSFQWYPTDLVHGSMLKGNYLRNIDQYRIPSENVKMFSRRAKMVYEFDMADVGDSYHYPAMARSFRTAGMQFATMFAYDPVQMAWANTEYPTHYLNLLYTPSKAISLLIAGKAFHRLPRGSFYGVTPANTTFDVFRVSYDENISEMNSDTEFYYSNSTRTVPKNKELLQHIAGCGSSPVVEYSGTGAYFLDKKEDGIWMVEIFPDVLWIHDPFGRTSLSKEVAKLFFGERQLCIKIPDIGEDFMCIPAEPTSVSPKKISSVSWNVVPGRYVVARKTLPKARSQKYVSSDKTFLEGLYIPRQLSLGTYVVNSSDNIGVAKNAGAFRFEIAAEQRINKAILFVRRIGWKGFAQYRLTNSHGFTYTLSDIPSFMTKGMLEYYVTVEVNGSLVTFPGEIKGTPSDWDFTGKSGWQMTVVDGSEKESVLFSVLQHNQSIVFPRYDAGEHYSLQYETASQSNELALAVSGGYSHNTGIPFGFQVNIRETVESTQSVIEQYKTVVLKMRGKNDSSYAVNLKLIQRDGSCYGATVLPTAQWETVTIPLSDFRQEESLILPHSYPLFLPKFWKSAFVKQQPAVDVKELDFIQIVLIPLRTSGTIDFEVVSLTLKRN